MKSQTNSQVEVAVIGGGVVGAAIFWELTRRGFQTALIESNNDVGKETSKANTAILHTGFDATPGSLESKLLTRGYSLLKTYSQERGIAVEETGALMIAWTEEERARIPHVIEQARENGVTEIEAMSAKAIYERESHLAKGALAGVFIPGESIICPFTPVISFVQEALEQGGQVLLNSKVTHVISDEDRTKIITTAGDLSARFVINAAGLYSDEVDALFGFKRFSIKPRKGQLLVFDKFARSLVNHVLLPIPTAKTKGVLVSPTVFGNVLLGPTAEDIDDKTDKATTEQGILSLLEKGRKILPELLNEEVVSTYVGLRAATEEKDYRIFLDDHYACVGGIRSTGLSASLGISEYIAKHIDLCLGERHWPTWKPKQMPALGEKQRRDIEGRELVCFCEKVSIDEIQSAIKSRLPPQDLDGLRRRTRCTQGRCQGFYCFARITELMSGR